MNGRVHVEMEKPSRPQRKATPRRLYNRLFGMAAGSVGTSNARGPDGLHAIHFAFTARGFASTRGRRWREGEAERAALYGVREDALEGGEAGWWSNIAEDRNELAAFFRILEALERHDRANANVYISEVFALPAELTARQRRRVVRRVCQNLDKRGLPYSAGIHLPDPTGDQRNYHVHIISSLRPATRTGDYEWSFATGKKSDINTPAGILARRQDIVAIINKTLRAAGLTKRHTALSNKARNMAAPAPKSGQDATWLQRRIDHGEDRLQRLQSLQMQVGTIRNGIERGNASMSNVQSKVRVHFENALARLQQMSVQGSGILEEFDRLTREREAERSRRRDYLRAALARMREAQHAAPLAAVRHALNDSLSTQITELGSKATDLNAAVADAHRMISTALQTAAARLGTGETLPSFQVLRIEHRMRLEQVGARLVSGGEHLHAANLGATVKSRVQMALARLEASSRNAKTRVAELETLRVRSNAPGRVSGRTLDDEGGSPEDASPLRPKPEVAEFNPLSSPPATPPPPPQSQDPAAEPKRARSGGLLAQAAALLNSGDPDAPRKPAEQDAPYKAGPARSRVDEEPDSRINDEGDALLARDEAARRAHQSRE
jgi:hypothetical protein